MLGLFLSFTACSPIDTFLTLLLSNGRERNIVDSYADLVDHARNGSGNETIMGPNLLKEVEEAVVLFHEGQPMNDSIIQYIISDVSQTGKGENEGTLKKTAVKTDQQFIIDSLGTITPNYNYTADYKCERDSGVDYDCNVVADIQIYGNHLWNANVRSDASSGTNAFLQLFVYLRGKVRPFKVNYNFEMNRVTFSCRVQKR